MNEVKIKLIGDNAKLPQYAQEGDACVDLIATKVLSEIDDLITYALGIATEIPKGHCMLVFPRSSIRKYDLEQTNSVGVIDSGYRGEWQITFRKTFNKEDVIKDLNLDCGEEALNLEFSNKVYKVGDRVCQTMLVPIPKMVFNQVEELDETKRGSGGFGSTGV